MDVGVDVRVGVAVGGTAVGGTRVGGIAVGTAVGGTAVGGGCTGSRIKLTMSMYITLKGIDWL